jgi:hypothetical protein
MWSKNPTRFYCKEKTKIEQSYNKKMLPKLMLNILKVTENYTSIIPIGHLIQKEISINFQPTYIWPMFTHAWPICKL